MGIVDPAIVLAPLNEKLDNKDISKWPATILAISRTDSVMGRIKFLTSSIITIKFIRAVGVPNGVRCDRVFSIELHTAFTIVDTHSISASGREVDMWAVVVKLNGIMATMFIAATVMNNVESISSVIFFLLLPFISDTSPLILFIIIIIAFDFFGLSFFPILFTINIGAASTIHLAPQ